MMTPDLNSPTWPRRWHFLVLALLATAAAVYGSLVPLRYEAIEFDEAVRRFEEIRYLPLTVHSRADWVANILLFMPISFLWLAVFLVDRRFSIATVLAAAIVVTTCAAASVALEFTQLWFRGRTVSQNDIVAETIGAVAGAVLWLLIGQTLTDWVRTFTAERRRERQIDWLLQVYLIGLLIYSVLPLDLTIRPAELFDKFRDGKVVLIPFADLRLNPASFYSLFRDVVLFIPVGMLTATWLTTAERPVRRLWASVMFGASIAAAIELAQLFVYSRHTAVTDVLLGTLGVGIGACLMRWLRRWRREEEPPQPIAVATRRSCLWLGSAGVYAVFVVAVFCAPFNPIDDRRELKRRYEGFYRVPFAALYGGSEYKAVSEVLKKGLFFAPLGAMLALAAAPVSARAVRCILMAFALAAAGGVAMLIEMAQVFFPPHVPDVTDVLLCTAGAAIGILVTVQVGRSTKDKTLNVRPFVLRP